MQMMNCPNCGKPTGFKRSLGFGTFFMVLLTFGLWLLAIPFYPLRCINCGLKSTDARRIPWFRPGDTGSKIAVAGIGLFVFVVLVQAILHLGGGSPTSTSVPASRANQIEAKLFDDPSLRHLNIQVQENDDEVTLTGAVPNDSTRQKVDTIASSVAADKKINDELQVQHPSAPTGGITQTNAASPPVVSAQQEPSQPITVNATELLAAYEADEKSATAKYEDRQVAVTGSVTGVFVPPPDVSLRMTEEGHNAEAFVTMAGPPISSPEGALLSPGITAYSETGSLFGGDATELSVGQIATLICTVGNGSKPLSGTGYALLLQDCRVPPASAGKSLQQTTTESNEQGDPVATYAPCAAATQHLRVPDQIALDLPGDFSSPDEPAPQMTFLFTSLGVDVYAVRTNKFGPAGFERLALLIFQDEQTRRQVLRSYIASGRVVWAYSDGGQDWKPIVNFKYLTLSFGWMQEDGAWEPYIRQTVLYAPPACDFVSEPSGSRPSSMIGIWISKTPELLPHNTIRYRAAEALSDFEKKEATGK